ncbi:MAG: hypothetical protein M3421_04275 [Bacteroidota bacterium]|nr:hypothetical protein [Bacteroidota bacterium]
MINKVIVSTQKVISRIPQNMIRNMLIIFANIRIVSYLQDSLRRKS